MCQTCGCGDERVVTVNLHERILKANDSAARHNREHFAAAGVLAINLMGSPGSGKTALIEATARALGSQGLKIAALSGDLATDHDGERLRAAGIPAATVTTGTACHLDADLVHRGLHEIAWQDRDVLFVENVGNLVCPAVYDLGQRANVVALAVTEGEDKPLKYPVMFRSADVVLLTKADLLPHLPDIRVQSFADALAKVMPQSRLLVISARNNQGMAEWLSWLDDRLAESRANSR
ncbi:MAG TPA: hydrogenase nickel incorporation protein HypB [Candidatus Binataceae bacterium]|nr:hydrogenase nickel incorporation protein HypB [Candidatus Binataceae bacterium]